MPLVESNGFQVSRGACWVPVLRYGMPEDRGIRVWSTPAYCVEITRDLGPPDRSEAPKKAKMDLWEDRERRARRGSYNEQVEIHLQVRVEGHPSLVDGARVQEGVERETY